MNAVEIEQAITELADQEFEPTEFPFAFLTAFGNKPPTIKRLRSGTSNKSDVGGVLQTNNIHLKVAPPGEVAVALEELRSSPATQNKRHKVRFLLATDGDQCEAEDLTTGETVACNFTDFPDHFGFFLPLAGISTVKQIRDSAFDIRATSRLNRLYVTLLQDNPDWSDEARRHQMNHFMARLIFCFFAEDTDIFDREDLFTSTVAQMSERDSSNTHEVISEIFRAMNVPMADRVAANLPRWANTFPYVNGGLFSGSTETPKFSRIAQRYLLHIGNLDWTQINPDIFGSMIQAVADEEERGALGMHYTSVPNILKVLNPLFLDDLRTSLDEAGDNHRKLLNLRKRMSNIRVFDPACGSGNFLVIAYKEMRSIEAGINELRGEADRPSDIPLTNFRGIELRDFSAEIARLALIIAEYQCDVLYRGPQEAKEAFLPLDTRNWITCGNALRLSWLSICPPTGVGVKVQSDDLFGTPLDQAEIDFANEGGETYICGNPPYVGSSKQTAEQKRDIEAIFGSLTKKWRSLDYVSCWFLKASDYLNLTKSSVALVSTNSICQGEQVPILWPLIYANGQDIVFARTSFRWSNLASRNAGVTVVVIGIQPDHGQRRTTYEISSSGKDVVRQVDNITAYLVPGRRIIVGTQAQPHDDRGLMIRGHMPSDGGNLILEPNEAAQLLETYPEAQPFIKTYVGAREYINGLSRYCLWIEDHNLTEAEKIEPIKRRIEAVKQMRLESSAKTTREYAHLGHKFRQIQGQPDQNSVILPRITSENRDYLPVGLMRGGTIISSQNFALYGAPTLTLSFLASKLHMAWISTVCGRTRTDFAYSNSLGWNTFPIPTLTEKNRADLSSCAEDILLAREAHFPATIADLYDRDKMPDDLRQAHDRNDETLERIYIGRRFKNDTERLEKLFELYTRMTTKVPE